MNAEEISLRKKHIMERELQIMKVYTNENTLTEIEHPTKD